jgi:hypothetical protein
MENGDLHGRPLVTSAAHGSNMLRTIAQFRRVNNALGVNCKEIAG